VGFAFRIVCPLRRSLAGCVKFSHQGADFIVGFTGDEIRSLVAKLEAARKAAA
jgi:hypothetical protein